MKEIKFRAWDKNNKIILTWGNLLNHETFDVLINNNYEIMQYTGLKDKNEKEIYEGDLLKANVGYGVFIAEVHLGVKQGWYPFMFQSEEESEIIGNIYENKDLLSSTTGEKGE